MYSLFKKMKKAFIDRFKRKPLIIRIKGILCWSLTLILSALILGGHFLLAAVFATLIALVYMAIVLACKEVEETNLSSMVDNCSYAAHRTVEIMLERVKEMAQSEQAMKELEDYDSCRSAVMATHQRVAEIQEDLRNVQLCLCDQNSMLKDYVLPELGIYFSDEEDDWVQCDVLDRKIPYGLISLRISNRLRDAGINTFADLVSRSENEILCLPDFGPSSVERVKQLLSLMDLHLKMTIKNEDGIWYYRRENHAEESVSNDAVTAEDELLGDESDKEEHV